MVVAMKTDADGRTRISTNTLIAWSVGFAILLLIAISLVAASSNPDPTDVAPGSQSLATSITNASVIVFREGLEAVLIFAAITASFLGARQQYRRPVTQGVAAAFGATVLTWFVMTALLGALPVSEDVLLAITGIAAVVILLLVMNWFFHKVYWTDHIKELNSKKRSLVDASETGDSIKYWGFFALGFTAVYREGFEVVLFLQNLNIVAGAAAVMWGVLIGLAGTAVVGFLTFFAHHKLPYKRMLVLTGVLLGIVLVVMIGGSARTLQSLGILSTTPLPFDTPDWWARWFEIVPTWETVTIQLLAAAFVMGSYYAAERWSKEKRRRANAAVAPAFIRQQPTAARVHAATATLPDLARRAPGVASSPAAVREVERVEAGADMQRTICGHPATTMCGCSAIAPNAAARMHSTGPAAPAVATPTAPVLTPRPLFEQQPPALVREPLFAPRVTE
ncbi:MAG: iron permease [Thermoleophilia bacterium]|nr:iron permease [Thermoleophilia bacterium]